MNNENIIKKLEIQSIFLFEWLISNLLKGSFQFLNTIAYAKNTFFGVSDHIPITFTYSKNMTFGNEEVKLDM